jgi:hypothetical protein
VKVVAAEVAAAASAAAEPAAAAQRGGGSGSAAEAAAAQQRQRQRSSSCSGSAVAVDAAAAAQRRRWSIFSELWPAGGFKASLNCNRVDEFDRSDDINNTTINERTQGRGLERPGDCVAASFLEGDF